MTARTSTRDVVPGDCQDCYGGDGYCDTCPAADVAQDGTLRLPRFVGSRAAVRDLLGAAIPRGTHPEEVVVSARYLDAMTASATSELVRRTAGERIRLVLVDLGSASRWALRVYEAADRLDVRHRVEVRS